MRLFLIGGLIWIFSSSHTAWGESRLQRCKKYLILLASFGAGMAVAETINDEPPPLDLNDTPLVLSGELNEEDPENDDKQL